ncbi:MAG: ABC transporter substrate-binding protein [Actinomycetota bacterium]
MQRLLRVLALLVAITLLAAACGSDDSSDDSSGSGSESGSSSASASEPADEASASEPADEASGSSSEMADEAFPVTISHAFGETVIESQPERIATVAWANHEVPLALGVVPVVMEFQAWGDDDGDGVLPWVEEQLEELGAETPELYDGTDGIDFETIADAGPDVILASYSGLTQEDYDTLTQIAPVVAYPDFAWGTPWDEMILMNSRAIGLEAEGEQLVADLNDEIASTFAEFPELADQTILFSFVSEADTSEIGFYSSVDTRPKFLERLGFAVPEYVAESSAASEDFFGSVSAEQADLLSDVDIVITYGGADTAAALAEDPLLSTLEPFANGNVVVLEGAGDPFAAAANPSPLSISWGLRDYLSAIAAVAPGADGGGETATGGGNALAAGASGGSTLLSNFAAFSPAFNDAVTGDGPVTAFLPSDDSLAAADPAVVGALQADPELLDSVLQYHVTTEALTAEDIIAAGSITTLLGDEITVTVDGDTVVLNDGQATVAVADIAADNGIAHVIDGLLLPASAIETLGLG